MMAGPWNTANPSNPLPLMTNRPLNPRNNTTPEDYEESEFGTEDGDEAILTPTSTQARASGLDDLPPTYEQAQAQSLRTIESSMSRLALTPSNPSNTVRQPQADSPSQSFMNHTPNIKPDIQNPTPPVDFASQGSEQSRALSRDHILVGIPSSIPTKTNQIPLFARAYSLKLSNLGIPSTTFSSFTDGLNTHLQRSTATAARQALLSLADPVGEEQTPTANNLRNYLEQANTKLFIPKGFEVSFQTIPNLLDSFRLEQGERRQEMIRMRKAIWSSKAEKDTVTALGVHIEPLTWSTPLPVSQSLLHQHSSHDRQGSMSSLRAAQCPWELNEQTEPQPDWLNNPASASASDTLSEANILTPTTSFSHRSQDDSRTHQASAALTAMLDDSATDSDDSTDSDTESRLHSHNRLAEAHRHYASVVRSIERTARGKIFELGDSPRHCDLVKYEGKRCAKLNAAAATKYTSEVKYSVATMQRRQRRANKWLDRELKKDGVKMMKHQAGEARREHGRRINREAAKHGERVKKASEELAYSQQDHALDQHETNTGWSHGKRKLSWEVWLVIRNIENQS